MSTRTKRKSSGPEIPGRIVAAYADKPSGPGWTNRLIWVISRLDDQTLVETAIQPEDQTPAMLALFEVCYAAHDSLLSAVGAYAATGKSATAS